MKKIPESWRFMGEHPHTTPQGKTTTIAIYKIGNDYSAFGGFLPINGYMVAADRAIKCINQCKAECDRYLKDDEVFDDIPF